MKSSAILVFLLIFTTYITPLSAQEERILPNDYNKAEVKGVIFQWKLNEGNIDIILSAPTEGWISVGFAPSKMMKDADILIGYVKNGEVFLRDDFGSGKTKHQADLDLGGTDDITVLGGFEANGKTTLKFSIPLISGDPYDKELEAGREYKLIFAYGKKDSFSSYHKGRGGLMVTL